MKKLTTIFLILLSGIAYSQSFNNLEVRNNFTLGDSTVDQITTGDTLATKEWTTENAAILTGNNTEVYFKNNGILSSTPLFTYDPADSTLTVDSLLLANGQRISWNSSRYTVNVPSGLDGHINQVGQELNIIVYNNSGSTIPNGTAVYPKGNFNGLATLGLVKASIHDSIGVDYGLTTVDISNNSTGVVTWFGEARGLNTSSYSVGDTIYASATTPGGLTNVRPTFPNYAIQIGIVLVSDASDGVIFVTSRATKNDTFINFWNGVFRESFDFRITSDGATITGTLTPSNGHPHMTMVFSDGFTTLDTDPGSTVTLTAGTDANPQTNYVYIPQSTKTLTANTSGFPDAEHIKVAQVALRSATATQTEGAIRNQNINDEVQNTTTNQGHLSHIGERIRQFNASWDSGTEATITGTTANVYVNVTTGKVYQMHKQTFPAISMSTGDIIYIVNDPTTPYDTTSNLNTLTVDANDVSLNNNYFTIVVWGVINKSGEESHIMCNLPTGSYNNEADAIDDIQGYTVYDIPEQFKGVGFLIARFVLRKSGSTFTYDASDGYLDLRGSIPNTTAGAGTGSSGITTFLGLTDTESSFTAYEFQVANAGATALESPAELTLNDSLKLSSGNLVVSDTVKVGGRIGIGTSEPQSALHIDKGTGSLANGIILDGDDSGVYANASNDFRISMNGLDIFRFTSTYFDLFNNAGPRLQRTSATATTPTVLPRADLETGLGWAGDDKLSIIAGGKEIARASENVTEQFIINPQGDLTGTLSNPSLAISETNTGFYVPSADKLNNVVNGVRTVQYAPDSTYHDSIAVFNSGIKVDNNDLTSTTTGDTIATKEYVDLNSTSITGNNNEILLSDGSGGTKTDTSFLFDGNTLILEADSGTNNVVLGKGSGSSITTADFNTFVGYDSGNSNTTGNANTFVGREAGLNNSTGGLNTSIGVQAGSSNDGNSNVFIGHSSGNSNTGSFNSMLGYQSGSTNAGSFNVFLGYQAGKNESGSSKLYIESSSSSTPLIYGEFDNDLIRHNADVEDSTNVSLKVDTIASAATITIDVLNNLVISGTADIDSIDVGSSVKNFQTVIIEFTGNAVTTGIIDGKNLKLNGDLLYTTDDILFIQRRGDYFYEISRSTN